MYLYLYLCFVFVFVTGFACVPPFLSVSLFLSFSAEKEGHFQASAFMAGTFSDWGRVGNCTRLGVGFRGFGGRREL